MLLKPNPLTEAPIRPARCWKNPEHLACSYESLSTFLICSSDRESLVLKHRSNNAEKRGLDIHPWNDEHPWTTGTFRFSETNCFEYNLLSLNSLLQEAEAFINDICGLYAAIATSRVSLMETIALSKLSIQNLFVIIQLYDAMVSLNSFITMFCPNTHSSSSTPSVVQPSSSVIMRKSCLLWRTLHSLNHMSSLLFASNVLFQCQ